MSVNNIINAISSGQINPLSIIEEIKCFTEKVPLSTYPDPSFMTHERNHEKEYLLEDSKCFSDTFAIILSADIKDMGFVIEEELIDDLGNQISITYNVEGISERRCQVNLKGLLKGGWHEIDEPAAAEITLKAITKNDMKNLPLYKELSVDGYLLSIESNIKMAFFTYFSAIEAIVRVRLDIIEKDIYPELHDALEHLSLDEKVRVVAKDAYEVDDLQKVSIWGDFQGSIREIKKTRNLIAHGKLKEEVKQADLDRCIACYLIIYCFSIEKKKTFIEIEKHLKNLVK